MLRKVRQVIPSFPLLPITSEDRKHSGQKTQIKLFNAVKNILLTSAEKFIPDKISD